MRTLLPFSSVRRQSSDSGLGEQMINQNHFRSRAREGVVSIQGNKYIKWNFVTLIDLHSINLFYLLDDR